MLVEATIQKQLGIKYVDAKRLKQEALESLGFAGPLTAAQEKEVVEEASDIFEDLEPAEQDAMRVKSPAAAGSSSEWQEKAKRSAERREKEWAEQHAREEEGRRRAEQEGGDVIQSDLEMPESTVVRKTVTKRETVTNEGLEWGGCKCVCTIL